LTIPTLSWERRLFALAHESLQHDEPHTSVAADDETLERAHAHCVAVTREHSKTFYLASGLLPPSKRRAVRALYAFCRVTDDLVDRASGDPLCSLERWRQRVLGGHPPADDLVALAWADARARYRIPARYAHQLIDGVARDVRVTRYATFDELAEYAYGVASTVGLMSMHIVGFEGPEAIPYAVKLGVALQLTNILRDVREDWDNGRLYLPQEDLAAFGLGEADVAAGRVDDRWRALMRFQIERNRRLYAEAMPGIAMLHADGRLAIAAAAELYRAILEDIEAHDGDVFTRRAHVSRWGKLRRLPGIWWRARRAPPWSHTEGHGPLKEARTQHEHL
jgi:phytoene synthase